MISIIKLMFWIGFLVFLWHAGILQFIMWFWAVIFMVIGASL